jgi:hypothetical protein
VEFAPSDELQKLAQAAARVRVAQEASDAFEAALASTNASEALDNAAAAVRGADADVDEAQAALAAAELAFSSAKAEKDAAEAAADSLAAPKWASADVDDDLERVESLKAGALAGATGLAASLPLFSGGGLLAPVSVFASCALFGIVYRYALRKDTGNVHLKGGVVAAFGLVRALPQVEAFLGPEEILILPPSVEQTAQAALLAGESVLLFALAAAALEAAMKRGVVSTFPKGR